MTRLALRPHWRLPLFRRADRIELVDELSAGWRRCLRPGQTGSAPRKALKDYVITRNQRFLFRPAPTLQAALRFVSILKPVKVL